jgi:hypothetical protein
LANREKEIAVEILRASGLGPSGFGLRLDRVVVGVLGDLRAFADAAAPADVTVLVTLSAPIRLPAKTVVDLKREIVALLAEAAPRADRAANHHGNDVRVRLVETSASRTLSLVGFVHNADSPAAPLLDIAEHWLRGKTAGLR